MATEKILESLLEAKLLALLRLFVDNPDKQFYLREIAKKAKVPPATTFRLVRRLLKLSIIQEIRVNKFKLYQLEANENTKLLDDLISTKRSALDEFVRMISELPEVESILLHGQESADRALILIIGHNINQEKVKYAVLDIKDRFKYNILELTVEQAQFEQMRAMGLYPGKKLTLYRKSP